MEIFIRLKNNSELINKEADKGGCVILMNKPHYKRMIFQNLNDANIYQECDNRIMKKIDELVNFYESHLTNVEKINLSKISFSTGNVYGLPKVYKSKEINEAIQQQNNE